MTEPRLDISTARIELSSMDGRLRVTPVIYVTRHGRDAFVIVSTEHFEAMRDTLEVMMDPEAMSNLVASEADIKAGRLHSHESVEAEER